MNSIVFRSKSHLGQIEYNYIFSHIFYTAVHTQSTAIIIIFNSKAMKFKYKPILPLKNLIHEMILTSESVKLFFSQMVFPQGLNYIYTSKFVY